MLNISEHAAIKRNAAYGHRFATRGARRRELDPFTRSRMSAMTPKGAMSATAHRVGLIGRYPSRPSGWSAMLRKRERTRRM
jgi:hypothetical protein